MNARCSISNGIEFSMSQWSEYDHVQEKMVGQSPHRFDISARRTLYKEPGDHRANPRFEEGFAQGSRVWNEDVKLLHQSGRKEPQRCAPIEAGTRKGTSLRACERFKSGNKEEDGLTLAQMKHLSSAPAQGISNARSAAPRLSHWQYHPSEARVRTARPCPGRREPTSRERPDAVPGARPGG